jgi:hypothetical protein
MTIAYFPGTSIADVINVGFVDRLGIETVFALMIDSGFTGQSGCVLPKSAAHLAFASVWSSQIAGAIQGLQQRIVVQGRIGALPATGVSFSHNSKAGAGDYSPQAFGSFSWKHEDEGLRASFARQSCNESAYNDHGGCRRSHRHRSPVWIALGSTLTPTCLPSAISAAS